VGVFSIIYWIFFPSESDFSLNNFNFLLKIDQPKFFIKNRSA
jgi:hypothetical protein